MPSTPMPPLTKQIPFMLVACHGQQQRSEALSRGKDTRKQARKALRSWKALGSVRRPAQYRGGQELSTDGTVRGVAGTRHLVESSMVAVAQSGP